MKTLFLSIAVLLACVNLGLGLKCYISGNDTDSDELKEKLQLVSQQSCNKTTTTVGKNDTDCDDLKETLQLVSLQTCTKTTTTDGDTVTVVRAGRSTKLHIGCFKSGQLEYCNCNTDACNTAAQTSTTLLPLIFFIYMCIIEANVC